MRNRGWRMLRRDRQRGVSAIAVVLSLALLIFAVVTAAKVAPTVIEYQSILKAVDMAKAGPTVADVRTAFDRMATVDNIASISGKELVVTKVGDKVVVSFQYNKEVELYGPVFLLIKYAGQSKQ